MSLLTYLAQKDFSGGLTPSSSPFSPASSSSANAGVLKGFISQFPNYSHSSTTKNPMEYFVDVDYKE